CEKLTDVVMRIGPQITIEFIFLNHFQVSTIDNKVVINIGLNNGRIRSRCYSLSIFPHRLIIRIETYLFGFNILYRAMVTAIEESKDLSSLNLDELIRNLKVHEVIMEKDFKIYKVKKEKVKSIALKAKKESCDYETLSSDSEDKEYAITVKENQEKDKIESKPDKNGKRERKPRKGQNQIKTRQKQEALIIYVDDMIITGNDEEEMTRLRTNLFKEFEMKDLGRLKYFLGIKVLRSLVNKENIMEASTATVSLHHAPSATTVCHQPHQGALLALLRCVVLAPTQHPSLDAMGEPNDEINRPLAIELTSTSQHPPQTPASGMDVAQAVEPSSSTAPIPGPGGSPTPGSEAAPDFLPLRELFADDRRPDFFKICAPLYKASMEGDWQTAENTLRDHESRRSTLLRCSITENCETMLHIAVSSEHPIFVQNLVNIMPNADLGLLNLNGNTALGLAAITGNIKIAKILVNGNRGLLTMENKKGMIPLYIAVLYGKQGMVSYLYDETNSNPWTDKDKKWVYPKCVEADLFVRDIALRIFQDHKEVAKAKTESVLGILARKSSAFNETKQHIIQQRRVRSAEQGSIKFIVELISKYHDLIWKRNDDDLSIFHIAVLHRHESIYNLLYEIGSMKDSIVILEDQYRNNMLHLVGMMVDTKRLKKVSGAAFQMQLELLWYKEVVSMILPSYRERKNKSGKTPYQLFT
nr:hypothetical protein [Tanacetum cinerariifolium]